MGARRDRCEAVEGLAGLPWEGFCLAMGLEEPRHWERAARVLRVAPGGNLRITVGGPRQHGKTTLALLLMAWWTTHYPQARIFYATYAQKFTESKTRSFRRLIDRTGRTIAGDHNTVSGWTYSDTGADFTGSSVEGVGNGLGANVVIVDDPFAGPDEVYNGSRRDLVYTWHKEVVEPMVAPGGSIIIIASRWDPDDLSGRVARLDGYDEIRIPAICDEEGQDGRHLGDPLCPWGPNPNEPRTLDYLLGLRDGRICEDGVRRGGQSRHAWEALYQGKPTPREGALFRGVQTWTGSLLDMRRVVIGVDIAFSAGSGSDWSVALAYGEDAQGRQFVLDVERIQAHAPEVAAMLVRMRDKWTVGNVAPHMVAYVSGGEIGQYDLMLMAPYYLNIERMPARWSKVWRAQTCATDWNRGNVFVVREPWTDTFIHEAVHFTGVNDSHDDQIDALVAAYDAMAAGRPVAGMGSFTFGAPCM